MESKQLAESYFRQLNLIVLGIFCSAIPSMANAVWTDVSPPTGAVLNYTLTPTNPATIFATNGGAMADRGVWRSTNSGGAWTQENDSANYKGAAVKIDAANVVLAAVSPGGVERSTTSGDLGSWAVTAGSGSTDNWVFGFAPSDPTTVYAGGATGIGAGVLQKSTNSGANWSAQSIDGDATPAIYSIAVDPTNANIAYAGSRPDGALNDGLYKTIDGGANWTLLGLNFTLVDALVIDPVDSNIIYAGTSGVDEIWRSLDAGATWSELFDASGNGLTNFNLRGITIDVGDRRVIYAAGGSTTKVVASSDCGANWTNVTSTGITGSPSNVLIDSTNNFVYVVENILNGNLYREVLGTGLAAASGACPATGGPGPGPGPAPPPAGGGGGGGGSGGGSPGLVFMLTLIGIRVFKGLKGKNSL